MYTLKVCNEILMLIFWALLIKFLLVQPTVLTFYVSLWTFSCIYKYLLWKIFTFQGFHAHTLSSVTHFYWLGESGHAKSLLSWNPLWRFLLFFLSSVIILYWHARIRSVIFISFRIFIVSSAAYAGNGWIIKSGLIFVWCFLLAYKNCFFCLCAEYSWDSVSRRKTDFVGSNYSLQGESIFT